MYLFNDMRCLVTIFGLRSLNYYFMLKADLWISFAYPANIYLFKINNINTKKMYEIYLKLISNIFYF